MDDTPEMIRSQMRHTSSDLCDKFETLENRISDNVEATAHRAGDTLTSVRHAMQSVSESLDFRLQVRRHPWLALGGAVAVGYLASRLLERRANTPGMPVEVPPVEVPQPVLPPASQSVLPATTPPTQGFPVQGLMQGVLTGVAHALVARGVPLVLDYFLSQQNPPPVQSLNGPRPAASLPLSSRFPSEESRLRTRNSI